MPTNVPWTAWEGGIHNQSSGNTHRSKESFLWGEKDQQVSGLPSRVFIDKVTGVCVSTYIQMGVCRDLAIKEETADKNVTASLFKFLLLFIYKGKGTQPN